MGWRNGLAMSLTDGLVWCRSSENQRRPSAFSAPETGSISRLRGAQRAPRENDGVAAAGRHPHRPGAHPEISPEAVLMLHACTVRPWPRAPTTHSRPKDSGAMDVCLHLDGAPDWLPPLWVVRFSIEVFGGCRLFVETHATPFVTQHHTNSSRGCRNFGAGEPAVHMQRGRHPTALFSR